MTDERQRDERKRKGHHKTNTPTKRQLHRVLHNDRRKVFFVTTLHLIHSLTVQTSKSSRSAEQNASDERQRDKSMKKNHHNTFHLLQRRKHQHKPQNTKKSPSTPSSQTTSLPPTSPSTHTQTEHAALPTTHRHTLGHTSFTKHKLMGRRDRPEYILHSSLQEIKYLQRSLVSFSLSYTMS